MAFRMAGDWPWRRVCRPVVPGSILLEPIEKLTVYSPSPSASNVTPALTAGGGQIPGACAP